MVLCGASGAGTRSFLEAKRLHRVGVVAILPAYAGFDAKHGIMQNPSGGGASAAGGDECLGREDLRIFGLAQMLLVCADHRGAQRRVAWRESVMFLSASNAARSVAMVALVRCLC